MTGHQGVVGELRSVIRRYVLLLRGQLGKLRRSSKVGPEFEKRNEFQRLGAQKQALGKHHGVAEEIGVEIPSFLLQVSIHLSTTPTLQQRSS